MTKINVTKTYLPSLEEYQGYLARIWQTGQVTNQGPLLVELQDKLRGYLGVPNIHYVTNGTIALQIALRALNAEEGEVITTPFSYVATTSSILWEKLKPVFVDIERETFNIDSSKIEAAITKKTKAIMAVHVFGRPCDIEGIDILSKRYRIPVIYDAAHAFGVLHKGRSLLSYGDISTCSFHATKVFHTIEGGCLVVKDDEISGRVELIKRFGHDFDEHKTLGINAKVSEFHAAMGLCNISRVGDFIDERKKASELYDHLLSHDFARPAISPDTEYNYSYYPLLLHSEDELMAVLARMAKENIFPRRYFYPSLNTLSYIKDAQECPVSEDVARRILCLPLYPGLEERSIIKICKILNK